MGESTDPSAPLRRAIKARHAIALYVASVLGSGVLILPGLAAEIAGPGSLLAWGLLGVAILPIALTFASLSARHPESGGIYGFAREAFGPTAGLVSGWLFALWMATGAPAVALIAASYLGYAFPLTHIETFLLGYALVAAAILVNWVGIVLSTRVQLALTIAILTLLVVTVVLAGFSVRATNFSPFLPDGLLPVGTAAALIFWSYLGYENVSNVAEEFENPARDFPRSVYASVAIVGVLYLAVALVTVGTDAYARGGGVAPFAALMGHVLGRYGAEGTAILAVVLLFGVVNAYTAGFSRVFYAAARDGAFVRRLAYIDPRTGAPSRVLLAMFVAVTVVFGAYYLFAVSLATALLLASGAAIVLYIIGSAAGVRLNPPIGGTGRPWRALTIASLIISLIVLPFVGWPVLAALAVAAVGFLYAHYVAGRNRPRAAKD